MRAFFSQRQYTKMLKHSLIASEPGYKFGAYSVPIIKHFSSGLSSSAMVAHKKPVHDMS
jgi:hypothetical protein